MTPPPLWGGGGSTDSGGRGSHGGLTRDDVAALVLKVTFTGLAHTLGDVKILIGIFSQTAGPTCKFWANPVNFRFQRNLSPSFWGGVAASPPRVRRPVARGWPASRGSAQYFLTENPDQSPALGPRVGCCALF